MGFRARLQAAHRHGDGRAGRGPIPKLASSVIPPALDRAVVEPGAAVAEEITTAGCNGRGGSDAAHLHRDGGGGRGPIPKLARDVMPPALDPAIVEACATVADKMTIADCNGSGGGDAAHLHRGGGGGRSPIPKLTRDVIPPTLDRAVA